MSDAPVPAADPATAPKQSACGWAGWFAALFLWSALGGWWLIPKDPAWVESAYTRGLYRTNVAIATALTQWAPFSIALCVVAAIVLGLPAWWAVWWVRRRRRAGMPHWRGVLAGLRGLLILAPAAIVWFTYSWGLGYARVPAVERLGLDASAIADDEAHRLRGKMLAIIERDLPPPGERDPQRAVAAIAEAMREVAKTWDGVAVTLPSRVKATPPGLLLANGTSGMAVPLTLEPHVDGGLPPTAFVQVAAHELGHVAGINVEAEATLIGFVAGLRAKDPYARYAVALDVYGDLAAQLPGEAYKKAIALLPDAARADRKAAAEAYRRYRIQFFQRWSWRVYDQYLKSQGIAEGRKNYGRGIALFVYAWRKGLVEIAGPAA